ncbi:hypothetical protein C8R44DRAFT_804494, partial [Mycena epipterygia]
GYTATSSSLGLVCYIWPRRLRRIYDQHGIVVLVYDYLLTIGSEVKIIWSSKRRLSKYWFLVVRYISLGCNATIVTFYFGNLSPECLRSCSTMEKVLEGFTLLQEVFVRLTLSLRVWGMYGFNRWVLVAILTTSIIGGAMGALTIIKYEGRQMPALQGFNGCHTKIPRSTAWEVQLAYDLLVFGLTVRAAWRDRSAMRLVPGSLIEILVRDACSIIVLASLANVLTLYLGDIRIARILSWWTTSLSVTLISRLNLNLQRAGIGNSKPAEFDTTELTNIHFNVPQNPPWPPRTADDLTSLSDV